MNFKLFFHYISYLQYPLIFIGLYFSFKPIITDAKPDLDGINLMLVFMGLAISFSTLQDTTKTQNNFSKRIWESPTKGKIALVYLGLLTLFVIVIGLIGLFGQSNKKLAEVSFGFIVLGIGLVGLLKTAIEMFENHRKDKNPILEQNHKE